MRARFVILALLAATAAVLLPAPAHADPYKWCAQYGGFWGSGGRNCGFTTYRQCMATVSGIGNVAGAGLGLDAMAGVPVPVGAAMSACRPRGL